jgi:hypothetical protein
LRYDRKETNIILYKCPKCKKETTDKDTPCPNCIEKGASIFQKNINVKRRSFDNLTEQQQKVLICLREKGGEGKVSRKNGSASMPKLLLFGLVDKEGQKDGVFLWKLTELGWKILKDQEILLRKEAKKRPKLNEKSTERQLLD